MAHPPPHSTDLVTFFDDLAAHWDAMQSPQRAARLARLLEPHAALFAHAHTVLDIGSGTGAFLPHLARLAASADFIALDLSGEMIRRAIANGRVERCRWVRGDGQWLPFAAAGFDALTCHDSFAHFEDREQALREFRRVLRRGGRMLILHDLDRETINAIHRQAAHPRVRTHLLPPVEAMASLVATAGFEVLALADDADHYLIAAQAT